MNEYIPGVCNIGLSERKNRRLIGGLGLIVGFGLTIILAPSLIKLIVFIPYFVAAIGILQDRLHFCANIGLPGIFNFKELGNLTKIDNNEFRKKDRNKALQIIGLSLISAIIATAISVVI